MTILFVDPNRCRLWEMNGRMEDYVDDESCEQEILSISAHGQLIPAIGRQLIDDPIHDVEIICGARRLYIAKRLSTTLRVELRNLTDKEAIVLIDAENRHRRDWSAYERGRSFLRWMAAGFFDTQDQLARSLTISSSQVSRMLKIAKLPCVVVDAFPAPAEITETWGLELARLCDDPAARPQIIAKARSLVAKSFRLEAHDTFEALKMQSQPKPLNSVGRRPRIETILSDTGAPLFRIKHLDKKVTVQIRRKDLSPAALFQIKESISLILQPATLQVSESSRISSDIT